MVIHFLAATPVSYKYAGHLNIKLLVGLFFAVLFLNDCMAATDPAVEANRLIQQQQQRLEHERQQLQRQTLPQQRLEQRQPPTSEKKPACLHITSITLDGATQLNGDTDERENILSAFSGTCMGVGEINNLLKAITHYYFDRGYVTTRAYIPEQDLSSGKLIILVIEGKLEDVQMRIQGQPARHEVSTALPAAKPGNLLNLRDLEQAIDQINRLASNQAQLELIPGAEPGYSRVVINNIATRRSHFSAGLDNSGQQSTGRLQRKGRYIQDNLLGVNDLLSIGLQQDSHREGERRKSRSANLYYEVPYGYWTFDVSASYFDYASCVESFATVFQTSGLSRNQQLGARYIAHRNSVSKTGLGFSLTRKVNRNYLEDVRLDSSSQTLTIGRLSANHLRHLLGGRFYAELAYKRGLSWFDAQQDEKTAGVPRAQFDSYTLQLQFQRAFDLVGLPSFYAGSLFYQYSDDLLFGSEQVSIGGEYTVNGFRDDSLSGSTGGYLRQELSSQILNGANIGIAPWLNAVELRLGLDAGQVKIGSKQNYQQLYSAWAGLRTTGKVSASILYARPFNMPDGIRHNSEEWYFGVIYYF